MVTYLKNAVDEKYIAIRMPGKKFPESLKKTFSPLFSRK
jgi:hypothetical protein